MYKSAMIVPLLRIIAVLYPVNVSLGQHLVRSLPPWLENHAFSLQIPVMASSNIWQSLSI